MSARGGSGGMPDIARSSEHQYAEFHRHGWRMNTLVRRGGPPPFKPVWSTVRRPNTSPARFCFSDVADARISCIPLIAEYSLPVLIIDGLPSILTSTYAVSHFMSGRFTCTKEQQYISRQSS